MARFHGLSFSPASLLRAFVPPHAFADRAAALAQAGLVPRQRQAARLQALRLPCLLQLSGSPHVALLVQVQDGQASLFQPGQAEPLREPLPQLQARLAGPAIECARPAPAGADPEAALPDQPFGFRWFVPLLLRHQAIWREVLVASFVIQLIALAVPLVTQVIIDKVIVHRTASTLAVLAAGLCVFVLFNAALTWVRQALVLHTGNRLDAQLGRAVFDRLLRLPLRYFEHRPTGVITARLQAVESLREFVSSSLVTLLLDLPFLLLFAAFMFWYSVPLTLLVLALVALIAGLSLAVAPVLRERLNAQFLLGAGNQAFLTEHIASLETVKSLQMEPLLSRRWRERLAAYLEAGLRTRQIGNTYAVAAGALEQAMSLGVLVAGAWIVMQGSQEGRAPLTLGMLVAFQMFAARLSQPLMRLVGLWQQFQQARIGLKRLADIMDAPQEPYGLPAVRAPGGSQGRVQVRGLAFRHAADRPWLYRGLDLTLEPGTTTVLVGPSG